MALNVRRIAERTITFVCRAEWLALLMALHDSWTHLVVIVFWDHSAHRFDCIPMKRSMPLPDNRTPVINGNTTIGWKCEKGIPCLKIPLKLIGIFQTLCRWTANDGQPYPLKMTQSFTLCALYQTQLRTFPMQCQGHVRTILSPCVLVRIEDMQCRVSRNEHLANTYT